MCFEFQHQDYLLLPNINWETPFCKKQKLTQYLGVATRPYGILIESLPPPAKHWALYIETYAHVTRKPKTAHIALVWPTVEYYCDCNILTLWVWRPFWQSCKEGELFYLTIWHNHIRCDLHNLSLIRWCVFIFLSIQAVRGNKLVTSGKFSSGLFIRALAF